MVVCVARFQASWQLLGAIPESPLNKVQVFWRSQYLENETTFEFVCSVVMGEASLSSKQSNISESVVHCLKSDMVSDSLMCGSSAKNGERVQMTSSF